LGATKVTSDQPAGRWSSCQAAVTRVSRVAGGLPFLHPVGDVEGDEFLALQILDRLTVGIEVVVDHGSDRGVSEQAHGTKSALAIADDDDLKS
jgi:hypothetical protein